MLQSSEHDDYTARRFGLKVCRKPTIPPKSTLPYIILGLQHILIISLTQFQRIKPVVLYLHPKYPPKSTSPCPNYSSSLASLVNKYVSQNIIITYPASCSDITGRLRRKPLCQRARLESSWYIAGPVQSTILDGQRH